MSIIRIVPALLVLAALAANAQTASVTTAPPSDSSYSVAERGPNHRVWSKVNWQTNADGRTLAKTNSYTELATALHYWDADANDWRESSEHIQPFPGGAAAIQGQHKVYFPYDISQGTIEMVTPEGHRLKSQPLCLSYFDGSNSVIIATLNASTPGQILGSNQVIYPNAFTNVQAGPSFKADLVYTYKIGSFEQDIVIRQQPPTPESYGMDGRNTRLEVLTEFLDSPQPTLTVGAVQTEVGELVDDRISFGVMHLGPGQAFMLGTNSPAARVNKRWLQFDGRQILLEEVPVRAIKDGLSELPLAQASSGRSKVFDRLASNERKLPAQRSLSARNEKPLEIAASVPPGPGFVLDYQSLNGNLTDYTFRSDTTYWISGAVNIGGVGTFEGGAVIKYAANASISINYPGSVQMLSAAYNPVVFTAKDDDTVGDQISGSSTSPSGYYANPAINYNGSGSGASGMTMSNFRIAYAQKAISAGGLSISIFLNDGQIVDCNIGYYTVGQGSAFMKNLLFARFVTAMQLGYANVTAQNVTFDGKLPAPPNYQSAFLLLPSGDPNTMNASFVNCILSHINSFSPARPAAVSGQYNGFYGNGMSAFGTPSFSPPGNPFQTPAVGGGSYYLAANADGSDASTFRNVGATSIDSGLLAELRQRTTQPPLIYSGTALPTTTFTPRAAKDNGTKVDLGYHYDRLDHVFAACTANANLTFAAGTAAGWYRTSSGSGGRGIHLADGVIANFNGTQVSPNYWVRLNTVQEQDLSGRSGPGGMTGGASAAANAPTINARFTHCVTMAGDGRHFANELEYAYLNVQATHCEFWNASLGDSAIALALTNCLLYRCSIIRGSDLSWGTVSLRNCTMWSSPLSLVYSGFGGTPWPATVRDCAFQNWTFSLLLPSSDFANNGFSGLTDPSPSGQGTGDKLNVVFTRVPGPLGDFYLDDPTLVDAGSRTATAAGLSDFTTQRNVTSKDGSMVDIGYHYVGVNASGSAIDSNGDGLPDWWVDLYALNPSDPSGDPDGDGLNNLREFQLGSSPIQLGTDANPLALPQVGAAYLRIISPALLELVRITAGNDSVIWNYSGGNPLASAFQVNDGTGPAVTSVGYKRRPLYNSYPNTSDLRIENTLYLVLNGNIPTNSSVQVQNLAPDIHWGSSVALLSLSDPLRYGPAIHVNQDGYIANQSKKAKVGYYLGTLNELTLALPLKFYLVDASGVDVYEGSLASRPDTGWNTGQAQYQHVLEADFSTFTTPGNYRLRVPGLGASFPFTINNNTALNWARTYALGLYHQRCGAANAAPFTRFTHDACHSLDAFIPATPAYPDLCSFQYHDGRLSCYNQAVCGNGTGCGVFDPNVPCGLINPLQTAPQLCHFSASLYPFVDSGTKNVSFGHHDAGDYSKYTINSAPLIHFLVFAADNFAGAGSLDNLGIPESSDQFSDILQEAKWEADFLVKMQDRGLIIVGGQQVPEGGFYFLVYPEYSEYEFVTPDRAPRQVLYPKITSATASAVAALADIASSPAFKSHYPTEAANYLARAVDGWNFLMRAINAHTKQGAYQKITFYGDDYTHDDELLWAAAALFAATGDAQYHSQFLAWLPTTFPQHDGYWRLFGSWGCAARDYAFALRSGRPVGALNATALHECEDEILASGNDWFTMSQNTSYGTSIPNGTKDQFNPGWYFSTERAFEIAVADALDQSLPSNDRNYDPTRHGKFVGAMIENFNYQHGCNPINQPFVTGVGSKRQRVIVHQYANWPNYDRRLLPPSGVPIGNLSDTYNNSQLNDFSYPPLSSSAAGYALYDRWADLFNLRTEFVSLHTARALAAAARLHGLSGAAYQQWKKADGTFSFPGSAPALNSSTVVRLDCSDPTVNLDEAQITWDTEFEEHPAVGRTFTIKPRSTIGETLVEAEAVLPDGRRVFGRQYLNINDPVNGGQQFPDPPSDTATVALYHFTEASPGAIDSSGNGYTLERSGLVARSPNIAWMGGSPSGQSAKFGGAGDRLQTSSILDSVLRANGSFTIEAWIYPKRYVLGSAGYLLHFAQKQGDSFNREWSIYFDGTKTTPEIYAPGAQYLLKSQDPSGQDWEHLVTPNTWHQIKITVNSSGTSTLYVDGQLVKSLLDPPSYTTDNWTLTLGDFVGDFDDIRISKTLR